MRAEDYLRSLCRFHDEIDAGCRNIIPCRGHMHADAHYADYDILRHTIAYATVFATLLLPRYFAIDLRRVALLISQKEDDTLSATLMPRALRYDAPKIASLKMPRACELTRDDYHSL